MRLTLLAERLTVIQIGNKIERGREELDYIDDFVNTNGKVGEREAEHMPWWALQRLQPGLICDCDDAL
jgi:hypothetical protein